MKITQQIRNCWQTSTNGENPALDGESCAWLASFAFHLAALILLGTLAFLLPTKENYLLTSAPIDLQEEEILPEEFHFSEEVPPEVGALSTAGATNAEAAAPDYSEVSEIVVPLETVSFLSEVEAAEVEEPIFTSPNVSERMLVKGTGSVGTTGSQWCHRSYYQRDTALARTAPHLGHLALRRIG